MDEFTPYFKSIVDALPVQQQRIFDAVALAWDPVEVATLATATRVPSNQVSAQLRSLVKAGFLAEAAGGPKRKTYLLADRFDNRARMRKLLARETPLQVTVVHGNADRVVPYRMGKELGEMGSSVQFHTIEGGTHELLFSGETEGYREVLKIVRNAMK